MTGPRGADDDGTAPFTDAELTALALAADPDQPLDHDAKPLTDPDAVPDGLLPSWYMPSPVRFPHSRVRTVAAILVVSGFALINVLGLCITYGRLTAG